MKGFLSVLLLAMVGVMAPAYAQGGPHGGGHGMGGHLAGGHFGQGGPRHWGGGWGPGYYGYYDDPWDWWWLAGTAAYVYDEPFYSYPAVVSPIVYGPSQPVVYSSSGPEPVRPIAAPPRFRYYCPDRGYYPEVQTCATDFIRRPLP